MSLPTRNWNWRIASTNGADSMSPTVPPSCEIKFQPWRAQPRNRLSRRHAHLDDADFRSLARLVDGDLRNALDPVLNRVRNVRDDLDRLPKVVSSSLFSPVRISSRDTASQLCKFVLTSFSMTSR